MWGHKEKSWCDDLWVKWGNSITVQSTTMQLPFSLSKMRTFCGGKSHMFVLIRQNDDCARCQLSWIVPCNSKVAVLHANVYRWRGDTNATADWRALWEKSLCFVCCVPVNTYCASFAPDFIISNQINYPCREQHPLSLDLQKEPRLYSVQIRSAASRCILHILFFTL